MDHELPTVPHADADLPGTLELGAFSVSLNVADLDESKTFYENLGFEVTGGDAEHGYLILKNGEAMIGLFQGMFEGNILTFNPGLTGRMERIEDFLDVRAIQERVRSAGIEPLTPIDPEAGEQGPASFTISDPDGNAILIDQFF